MSVLGSADSRMATILVHLELVSHGSCQAWNPSGGHSGEPDGRIIDLVLARSKFPHIVWRERYESQVDDLGRERVIKEAGKELEALTKRVLPRVEGKPLQEIIIEDGEGFDPKIVAERFNVDPAFVRRIRLRANRGSEDGKKVTAIMGEDRPSKARELRRLGLSTRQIADVLGCHQTQVMRWIRTRAAASA